jgi:alpha-L-arabinofuranosidase
MIGMHRRRASAHLAVLVLSTAACFASMTAAAAETVKADLTIHGDTPKSKINRNIYGQFAEHLGAGIYGGVWVGEDSKIPNTRGYRNDVVDALKKLGVPLVRWPGGCFADEYHWREGIGPRDKRPVKVNTTWGGVEENNAFGTHEFLDFAELIGADAYVNGNVGSGSPQEMAEWVEYITSDTKSTLANLRRQNGRDKPWKLPYFAVGNETWGCGGNMRPEFYADVYRQFATFIKAPKENRPKIIASGANSFDVNFTEVLMREAGKRMNALSVHYYTLVPGKWPPRGSATQFSENEWIATLFQTLRMDELIRNHSAVMDKYDPDKKVELLVDEWGTWYEVEPGTNPGFLYQQNSLRDAVVAAINLNIFHAHSDRVKMTNIAQMVNVLQAMILTNNEKMVLTPTYHVFEMYKPFQDATFLPVDLSNVDYKLGETTVPALHASASRDAQGKVHVGLANLDPNRAATVTVKVAGGSVKKATGRVLTAPAINAINTFDKPDTVKPVAYKGATVRGGQVSMNVPAKSVIVLELE